MRLRMSVISGIPFTTGLWASQQVFCTLEPKRRRKSVAKWLSHNCNDTNGAEHLGKFEPQRLQAVLKRPGLIQKIQRPC